MLQLVKEGQFYRAQKTSIVNICASPSAGKRVSANYNFCVVFFFLLVYKVAQFSFYPITTRADGQMDQSEIEAVLTSAGCAI